MRSRFECQREKVRVFGNPMTTPSLSNSDLVENPEWPRRYFIQKVVAGAAVILAASALSFGGCATSDGAKGKESALVCPQCKMVAVDTMRPDWGFGRNTRLGWVPAKVYEDQCPGCQGVIETLFKEGKWKHKCSICKDSPYTCPVVHP